MNYGSTDKQELQEAIDSIESFAPKTWDIKRIKRPRKKIPVKHTGGEYLVVVMNNSAGSWHASNILSAALKVKSCTDERILNGL